MKKRERLTPELQALAAEAFGHASCVASAYGRKYPDFGADWSGEIAVRICCLIATFDPSMSSLRSWAISQAHFACKDAIRAVAGRPGSRRRRRRIISLDAPPSIGSPHFDPWRPEGLLGVLAAPPVPCPDAMDDALAMLKGLRGPESIVLREAVLRGRTHAEVAAELGCSESRISQIRAAALQFLRNRVTTRTTP